MPVVPVIDEVEKSLSRLLDEADWTSAEDPHFQKPLISFESPKDIQEHPPEQNTICIFLYQIAETVYLKNLELERLEQNRMSYSPLFLDFYYLIVPYSKKKRDEKWMLGTVIQIFANHPVLTEGLLHGGLGKTDHAIRLLFHSLSLDELTKIWSAFQTTGYHLSVAYLVTPVPVEITLETHLQKVVSKEMKYASGHREGEESG